MNQLITFLFIILPITTSIGQSYLDTTFTNYFKRGGNGWNAGDGTSSVALPDGRTLWMFGDSHVDQGVNDDNELPCLFNARNSIMVQDQANNFSSYYDTSGTDRFTRQFVKMEGDTNTFYWPSGGFVHNNIAYLFWNRFKENENSIFGDFLGMVIAEIELPTIELIKITPLENTSLQYGMAIITNQDNGYHYIYGRVKEEGAFRQPLVARCPIGQIYTNWEYYAGDNNWSTNAIDYVPIADFVSEEYSVFQCGETYIFLTQDLNGLGCDGGKRIYMSKASQPQGPFNNVEVVYTATDQVNGDNLFTYNAQAHPQFIKDNEVLVSYNVNKTCPHICQDTILAFSSFFNADLYRPKFVRVPITECISTSISVVEEQESIKIYPNPVHQVLKVEIENTLFEEPYFELYNLLGVQLKKGNFYQTIDLKDITTGMYILKIISNNQEQFTLIHKL